MIDVEIFNGLVWRELHGKEIREVLENATIEDMENMDYSYVDANGKNVPCGILLLIRQGDGTRGIVELSADNDDYECHRFAVSFATVLEEGEQS